jgi:hypothetical protein
MNITRSSVSFNPEAAQETNGRRPYVPSPLVSVAVALDAAFERAHEARANNSEPIKTARTYFNPIAFCCPHCQQKVTSKAGQIFCRCISVEYKGRLDGVIPRPDEIIPLMREGTRIDVVTLVEETAFRCR